MSLESLHMPALEIKWLKEVHSRNGTFEMEPVYTGSTSNVLFRLSQSPGVQRS